MLLSSTVVCVDYCSHIVLFLHSGMLLLVRVVVCCLASVVVCFCCSVVANHVGVVVLWCLLVCVDCCSRGKLLLVHVDLTRSCSSRLLTPVTQ